MQLLRRLQQFRQIMLPPYIGHINFVDADSNPSEALGQIIHQIINIRR